MVIYTSYFGNMKKLSANGVLPICVALYKPRFFTGVQLQNVAPTRYMLSPACSEQEYIKLYNGILSRLNAFQVLNQIKTLSGGRNIALCCYEKPDDFCHRHILAQWLSKETGTPITEFGVVERKEPEYKQTSMF